MITPLNSEAWLLDLDEGSLDPSTLSMGTLMREINLKKRPPLLLRKMMNALEAKRQKKRLGWSRPWNKIGMTVFRTHIHHRGEDDSFFRECQAAFQNAAWRVPAEYQVYADSLWQDPSLMAFTFYHNRVEGEKEYEGLTLSFGRKLSADRTKRDRLDFILEDLRVDGKVDGVLDKARIIVNPMEKWEEGQSWTQEQVGGEIDCSLTSLFLSALALYRQYRDQGERQWSHWASRYIDYFGPRGFIPQGSAFT